MDHHSDDTMSGPTQPVCDGLDLLPQEVPKPPRLAFTGPGEGWPPRPVGQSEVRFLQAEPIAGTLTDSLEQEILKNALEDRNVRSLLGGRFAHIHTDSAMLGKGRHCDQRSPLETRLVFFSHSNNIAAEVEMRGLRVVSAMHVPGFQPPEGEEEIEEAIGIARADHRLSHHVRDLEASVLLNMFDREDPCYGLRVFWVSFTQPGDKEGEKPALFTAAVDIVNRRVLVARQEPETGRPEDRVANLNDYSSSGDDDHA